MLEQRLSEILLEAAGLKVFPLSAVERPTVETRFVSQFGSDGFAIAGLDLTIDLEGRIRLIEMNGSNMGATSLAGPRTDILRARHMVQAAEARIKAVGKGVVLIAYAERTGLVHEHGHRAVHVCREISRFRSVSLINARDELPTGADLTIVFDTIDRISDHIRRENHNLVYKNLPVVSAANPNLLPELVRRGIIERSAAGYILETNWLHDGRFTSLVHDKGLQQDVASGTGIEPLLHRACNDLDACLEVVRDFHKMGLTAVAKMNAGSGGVGIKFFPPSMTPNEVRKVLLALHADAVTAYPGDLPKTIFPIRVFQFVQSSGYPLEDGQHLWDIRFLCLVSPGQVEIIPCEMRLCPAPFPTDGKDFGRDAVVNNTTGRAPTARFVRSPLAINRNGTDVELRLVGIDDRILREMAASAARWCQAAWNRCEDFEPASGARKDSSGLQIAMAGFSPTR